MEYLVSKKGRHCCSVEELRITFASTCNPGCKESVFNVLFLVLDFPLGAPYIDCLERELCGCVLPHRGEGA